MHWDCVQLTSFDTLQDRAADFGILDVGNDVRNGVVWFDGIEQVYTDNKVCLEFDAHQVLRFRVLDEVRT